MPTCAVLSFRLGGTDGVSVVAATWVDALAAMGFDVMTVAGDGVVVDRFVPELAIGRWPDGIDSVTGPLAASPADIDALVETLEAILVDVDLVIVENLGTIPMNLPAARAVARARSGLPTIWHHHDPAWQRDRYASIDELPIADPAGGDNWRHVAINDLTRDQLIGRGFAAITIRNGFDVAVAPGDRTGERRRLGFADDELVMVHPVRAIERKNIPAALTLAAELGATYWLTGPAEEHYADTLDKLLTAARRDGLRIIHAPTSSTADLYAAADLVVFPSTWEGFGNPPVEAAIHRKPAVVSHYPVAEELRALGFEWFDPDDVEALRRWFETPDETMLDRNRATAVRHLSLEAMQLALRSLLDEAGWLP
jgi:glycosyltransferase involved in cell wall biosynthesis